MPPNSSFHDPPNSLLIMVSDSNLRRGLIVGNYCHDVLLRDTLLLAHTLGGAPSFITPVLDSLSLPFHLISKVGPDFPFSPTHPPLVVPNSHTTLFHAHFGSALPDRVLNRVASCDPITPSDLPMSRFAFGLAVGVAGEILPETLEKMVEICDVVFVDVQGLIRRFDGEDGCVRHVGLRESGFFHLLPRIGFLKASEDEAAFVDVEEVRRWCCVVVTHGKDGCEVFWKDGGLRVDPFGADQVDPTGAGDCFLGGFAAGIVKGLAVADAALLGNFFGSLAVARVGPPALDSSLFQVVKDEIHKRKMQDLPCSERRDEQLGFQKPPDQGQFYASLDAAKDIIMCQIQESGRNILSSPKGLEQNNVKGLSLNPFHDESITSVNGEP